MWSRYQRLGRYVTDVGLRPWAAVGSSLARLRHALAVNAVWRQAPPKITVGRIVPSRQTPAAKLTVHRRNFRSGLPVNRPAHGPRRSGQAAVPCAPTIAIWAAHQL